MQEYGFKLYVTGKSLHSQKAIENLRRICEEVLGSNYELAVVDVLEDPGAAEKDKILATPTLIRSSPLPARRLIGDLSDTSAVITALGL